MSVNEKANQKWLMYSKFWSRYHKTQGFKALTMIDPASSSSKLWSYRQNRLITKEENGKERTIEEEIFDKSSD